ncbi:sperm-associated antigen 8-like [Clavelina lepadiformis]|uniref:sperm-associated antigen 8-like n=1 Tax=Clavelina lepadiformis TaxID=159417 RepID=UPI004043030F
MSLYEGRNEIRYNNSGGKCLLENWVEERATASLEPTDVNSEYTSSAQLHRHGHKGLLTLNVDATAEKQTTVRQSYQLPTYPGVRTRGKKEEIFERMLFSKVGEETHKEFNPPPPAPEFITIKQQDFDKADFKSIKPPATMDHNVSTEQCITFWSTHRNKIHGMSQIKTRDTPFKKNAAFSTPISEYLEQTQPHDQEQYPNM